MNPKRLLLLLSLFASPILRGQEQTRIDLLFAGDIMQHDTQLAAARQPDSTYCYQESFKYVKDEISRADIAIGNLEVPLGAPPYSGYPAFCAPPALAEAVKNAGFDLLVLANNHSVDRHKRGVKRTIDILDSLGTAHTGIFKDTLSRNRDYPLFFERNGIRFALLNSTYGTNGIPHTPPNFINVNDTVQWKKDLEKAKAGNPDFIVFFVHWGEEYQFLPNPAQERLARFLIDNGVQLVIGSHPHVVQPMKKIYDENGKTKAVVVYSLGNYLSGQRTIDTQGGAALRVALHRDGDEVSIGDCAYSLAWVWKPLDKRGLQRFILLPVSRAENGEYPLSDSDRARMDAFAKNARAVLNEHNTDINEYQY